MVTSEKDVVKMKKVVSDKRINYLNIEVAFMRGESELMNSIEETVNL